MQTIKIKDNWYLNTEILSVKQEKSKAKETSKNYFMILDVSWSMSGVISQMREDLKNKLKSIMKNGDTITLARFSSEGGQYEYFTIGFRKAVDSDFDLFDKKIDEKIHCLGATCFSEVLSEFPKVVKQVNDTYIGTNIAFFLTDGEPCVSNYKKEKEDIFTNLANIKGQVDNFTFIGYTNYYNRNLLSEMTETVNGNFIHSSEFSDYVADTNKVFQNFSNNYLIYEKETPSNTKFDTIFSIEEDFVINQRNEEGKMKLYVNKHKDEFSYSYFTTKPTSDFVLIKEDVLENPKLLKNIYASVLQLNKTNKRLEAMEILLWLGDVHLLDIYNNALTTAELAYFDMCVEKAVFDETERFKEGRKANYLPSPNKFCLVELFELFEQENVVVNVEKLKKNYNKTTLSMKTENNWEKFIPSSDYSKINSVVWNSEEINMNLQFKIEGIVDLSKRKENLEKLNIPRKYHSYNFKNYSIVSDGILNTKSLFVKISEDLFKKLQNLGSISKKVEYAEEVEIDLTQLPIINKKVSRENLSSKFIAETQVELEIVKAKLKVVNSFLPTKKEEFENASKFMLSEEASNILKEIGITAYGYSPKRVSETSETEEKDYRVARTFEVKVKGFSSLPKVTDLTSKSSSASAFVIMKNFLIENEKNTLEDWKKLKEELEKEKAKLTALIRRICFAVILGRTQFEEDKVEVDGNEVKIQVSFEFGLKKVRIA